MLTTVKVHPGVCVPRNILQSINIKANKILNKKPKLPIKAIILSGLVESDRIPDNPNEIILSKENFEPPYFLASLL